MARSLVDEIATKSDGNPLFALEIVRGLRNTGSLKRHPAYAGGLLGSIDAGQIPSTVADLIRTRLLDLDERDREILDVAACCAFEFDPGLVAGALETSRIEILKRLGVLEREHRLVRAQGLAFRFDHHQLQAVVYSDLPGMLRQEYHTAIALALEAGAEADAPRVDGALAAEVFRHFLEGAQGDRGLAHLEPALDYLARNYLNAAAIRLSEGALSAPGLLSGRERIRTLLHKADRLALVGRHDDERSALDEAIALSEVVDDNAVRVAAHQALGAHCARVSDYSRAMRHLEQALNIARVAGDERAEATSTDHLGSVLASLGRWEEARSLLEWALARHRKHKDRKGELRAANSLEAILGKLGWHEESLEQHELVLDIAQMAGFRRGEARAMNLMGFAYARFGCYEDARQRHESALGIAREIGYRCGEGDALQGLGDLAEETGDPERAMALYRDALTLRQVTGDRRGVADTLVALGRQLAAIGQQQEAAEHLEKAFELGRWLKAPSPTVLSVAHRALLPGGDIEAAVKTLAEQEPLLVHQTRMVVSFLLWQATAEIAYLRNAHRFLLELSGRAPEAHRDAMLKKVPVNRAIAAAWEAAGAASGSAASGR